MKLYGLQKKDDMGSTGRKKLQKAIYYLKTRPDKDIKVLVQHNTTQQRAEQCRQKQDEVLVNIHQGVCCLMTSGPHPSPQLVINIKTLATAIEYLRTFTHTHIEIRTICKRFHLCATF